MVNTAVTLEKEKIKSFLLPENRDVDISVFESIDSTNTEAKRRLENGDKRTMLICAEGQTAGRGRHGKSFYSPEKTGVYFTLVIHPDIPLSLAARATTAAAVSVVEAIRELTDKKPLIKWVNDVFLDGKKICGILTEAVSPTDRTKAESLIIGIGINISTSLFPDEIKDTASSLGENELDKNELIARICNYLFGYAESLNNPTHIEKYKKYSLVLGKEITYEKNGRAFFARAVDIDENGSLKVETENGIETLDSGEISIKLSDK